MNIPKAKKNFCKKCKKHTPHKVTQYKTGKASLYAQGEYRDRDVPAMPSAFHRDVGLRASARKRTDDTRRDRWNDARRTVWMRAVPTRAIARSRVANARSRVARPRCASPIAFRVDAYAFAPRGCGRSLGFPSLRLFSRRAPPRLR